MRRLAFIFLIAIAHSSLLYAASGDAESVRLMVGRSAVVDTGTPIARVSLTSADIADALVTSPNQVLINGKMPGTISLFVWDRGGALKRYEVVVQRDLARLSEQLATLFPGESIVAHSNGRSVVLSGNVTHKDVIEKAASVAAGYVDKKDDVVSLLQVRETGSNQVLLRVRFAEVSRSAMTELGAGFFTSPTGFHSVQGRVTTQQFAAPVFDDKGGDKTHLVFSDFLNFFLWDFKHDLGTVIKALQARGLFQSLAEPNLVAESGKEASFLAGGEFPVPVAQPSGGGLAVTIQFKEFGIRLNFTPIVNGDRVHLKVRPEVSTLDFANGLTLQGFRVPALATRRTETELELQNGQTFAIAGLINNTMNKTLQKVPGIGDIPILGLLFQSQAAQKDRTELVVMITPEILPRASNGVTGQLPKLQERYLAPIDPKKALEPPAPAFRTAPWVSQAAGQSPALAQSSSPANQNSSSNAPLDPAAAAAAVSALNPTTKQVLPGETPSQPNNSNTTAPARNLTRDEQATFDEARQAERDSAERQSKAQRTQAAAASKQLAKQAEIDRKKAMEDQKRLAEAQKRQAAIDKVAQEAAAKRAAEQAKKQAEIDRKQQKAIAEAEAKLKAAQAAYDAAKKQ